MDEGYERFRVPATAAQADERFIARHREIHASVVRSMVAEAAADGKRYATSYERQPHPHGPKHPAFDSHANSTLEAYETNADPEVLVLQNEADREQRVKRLRSLLSAAKDAHVEWERENGTDPEWPDWYARYIIRQGF